MYVCCRGCVKLISPCAESSRGDLNSTEVGLISLFRVWISCRERERQRVRESASFQMPSGTVKWKQKKQWWCRDMIVCRELKEAQQHCPCSWVYVKRSMCYLHCSSRTKVKGTYGNAFCLHTHLSVRVDYIQAWQEQGGAERHLTHSVLF